jgi:hypothetical protein
LPTFCRHNRFAETCPICSKTPRVTPPGGSRAGAAPRAPRKAASSSSRTSSRGPSMKVRRLERAPEDGFSSGLVPGLRSSVDARRLAEELAFSVARLEELELAPPGLLADVAAMEDREEAAWLLFLVAWLSPVEGDDPWAGIEAARVPFASGELPRVDGVPLGERTACQPARADAAIARYRQVAERSGGSQLALLRGEESWTPGRRFDRAFERLAVPGFHRSARFEFLVLAGRLGLAELEPTGLQLGARDAAMDPVVVAAKRIFGIGDAINLARRSSELAAACEVPIAAFDLALANWARPEGARIRAGSLAEPDDAVRRRAHLALGIRDEAPAEPVV